MKPSEKDKRLPWKEISRAYDELSPVLGSSLKYYRSTVQRLGEISGRLLDAGCGRGLLLAEIRKHHPDVELYATDLSPLCAKHGKAVSSVALAPAEALPFPDNTFDYVTMSLVIEHCLDDEKALAEVHRCLKPGGRFFVSTDNRTWLQVMGIADLFRPEERRYKRLGQVTDGDYTDREFRGLLKRAGFTDVHREPSGPFPFLPALLGRLPVVRARLTKRLWYLCRRPPL